VKLTVTPLTATLAAPFASARGALSVRDLVLVRLDAPDGAVGWGEAAPLEVDTAEVLNALAAHAAVLAAADEAAPLPDLLAACAAAAALPEALAAIDLALWDLAGRRADEPVWRLLGAGALRAVELNATIAAPDRAGAAAQAQHSARAGFRCIKVKVGLGDDAGRLAAVRAAAGPAMAIRLDANGAWSVEEAAAALNALAPVGLELCEEPVHGLDAVAELAQRSGVPIAIDETTREPGALGRRVCAAVCLKVSRLGGITRTLEAATAARASGYEVYLASMLDGPLGIAAALHVAVAIRPDRPCGLATLGLFTAGESGLEPDAGSLAPPPGAGLGDGLLRWYATAI
jgi:L-alanine-DL-glutamate epimerase-like enolase superfamily enzyme